MKRRLTVVTLAVALLLGGCGWGLTRKVDYNLPALATLSMGQRSADGAAQFAELFCGTLRHVESSANEWGDCNTWLHTPTVPQPAVTTPIPRTYGVLVVAGIFSQCIDAQGVRIFAQGLEHLRSAHGLVADEIRVSGVGSSEANATQIEAYLQNHPGEFIAIGYSKGIADLMVALQDRPQARARIKALVSVAGAVGGSRLADIPTAEAIGAFEKVIKQTGLGACDIQDAGGLKSLTRADRYRFLSTWTPPADLRTFSIVGVTTYAETSKALQPLFDRVRYYSIDQDSQVVAEEGILPGARYLGRAKGDHWAVALPFWETNDANALRHVDKNRFPRTALLEAIVREVHR